MTYSCDARRARCHLFAKRPIVIAMLLVLLVAVGNFVLGFCLAAHLGHGPAWAELPHPNVLRDKLRSALRRRKKNAATSQAAT